MNHPVHPQALEVVEAIDAGFLQASRNSEETRCYIGASTGHDCVARLQLSLRGFPSDPVDAQLQRIFREGHRLEYQIVRDLKERANLRVYEKDSLTGKQHSRSWLGGHIVCHSDGLVDFEDGSPLSILEIKTMNEANFNKFVSYGVKASHKKYYSQMMMMLAMFGIERSLFISYCKNNSKYHAEIVHFDQSEWDEIYNNIQAALDGHAGRIASYPEDWRCKMCFKKTACWENPKLSPACRFCKHSKPNEKGGFSCKLTGKEETEACEKFEQLKMVSKI
ncbi:MAG: hypothetical protein CMO97_06085 [Woeseia sp.]|nr:hypothetical protein [Woeseia sp.]|tara:strand:- start:8521 stop:9354 length:834 start_codon:yes stop_codon:yes gene_type:complete